MLLSLLNSLLHLLFHAQLVLHDSKLLLFCHVDCKACQRVLLRLLWLCCCSSEALVRWPGSSSEVRWCRGSEDTCLPLSVDPLLLLLQVCATLEVEQVAVRLVELVIRNEFSAEDGPVVSLLVQVSDRLVHLQLLLVVLWLVLLAHLVELGGPVGQVEHVGVQVHAVVGPAHHADSSVLHPPVLLGDLGADRHCLLVILALSVRSEPVGGEHATLPVLLPLLTSSQRLSEGVPRAISLCNSESGERLACSRLIWCPRSLRSAEAFVAWLLCLLPEPVASQGSVEVAFHDGLLN